MARRPYRQGEWILPRRAAFWHAARLHDYDEPRYPTTPGRRTCVAEVQRARRPAYSASGERGSDAWIGSLLRRSGGEIRGVFLDRDGVINVNRPDHVKSWEELEFIPRAVDAIVRLARAGPSPFVVTHQAIVNHGVVARELVEWMNLRMQRVIELHGGSIRAIAYCPHRPEEGVVAESPDRVSCSALRVTMTSTSARRSSSATR